MTHIQNFENLSHNCIKWNEKMHFNSFYETWWFLRFVFISVPSKNLNNSMPFKNSLMAKPIQYYKVKQNKIKRKKINKNSLIIFLKAMVIVF